MTTLLLHLPLLSVLSITGLRVIIIEHVTLVRLAYRKNIKVLFAAHKLN